MAARHEVASLEGVVVGEGGSFDGVTAGWTAATTPALAELAPGASVTLTLTASIAADTLNGATVLNQASARDVSGAEALSDDPSTDAPGDPTRFEVLFPALIVEKRVVDIDGGGFEPGDVVQYTFDLRIDAGVPVTGIALTD